MNEAYKQYDDIIFKVNYVTHLSGPHCDSLILHRSDKCEYCGSAKFQELHTAREVLGINYTGEYKPDLLICPAENRRNLFSIEQWGGNRPWS